MAITNQLTLNLDEGSKVAESSADTEMTGYGQQSAADAELVATLLDRLNEGQAACVKQVWGPSLIIAGAGSGKTTVLTRRIAYIISKLRQEPESVLAVTFTNKAAAEMRHRVEAIVGPQMARRITIGTFHSICARLLRLEISNYKTADGLTWDKNFVIYDETDTQSLVKAQVQKLNLDDKVFVPKEIRHTISSLKNDGYTHDVYATEAKNYREGRLAEIFTSYQTELSRNNALDFDDLILIFTDLLQKNPMVRERTQRRFRHVLVDEFQDTNKSQYDLISIIANCESKEHYIKRDCPQLTTTECWKERSLLVVGDVDQSIYSWRQADFRIILNFQKEYEDCKLIKLEENYRSTETILEVANSIIANNTERIDKVLRCNRGKGGKVNCYEAQDEIDEAFYIAEELKRAKARGRQLSDCVILYRTNSQSRAIEEVLVRSHIPYLVVGGTRFYDRQEIKDMIAYLKLIFNQRDGQAFNRVVNVPKRGLGKTSLDRLTAYAELKGISNIEAALESERIADLSTKAVATLKQFSNLVLKWNRDSATIPVSALLEQVLKDTSYLEKLEEEAQSSKDELALGRIDNIKEFVAVAVEFEQMADEPTLDAFLTRISLVSDLDKVKESDDTVKLMTIHSSKGLEFPVAFLMGLEEGLFPHVRSLDNPSQLEEERRLMYVAVTRAGDSLHMTLARKRTMRGFGASGFSSTFTIPSRFLKEIKPGLVTGYYPTGEGESGYAKHLERQAGTWDKGQPKSSGNFGGYERQREPGADFEQLDTRDRYQDQNKDRSGGYGFESKYGGGGGSGYGGNSRSSGSGGGNARSAGSSGGSGYGGGNFSPNRYGSAGNTPSSGGRSGSGSGYGSSGGRSGSGSSSGGRSSSGSGSSFGSGSGSSFGSGSGASRPAPGQPGGARPVARRLPQSIEEKPPEFERLNVGDRISHVKFGAGTVHEVIGRGEKELYVINFDDHGEKKLDPTFAKLIKLT